jgi:hypothetical protein
MCDSKYRDVPVESNEHNVVGEVVDRKAPDIRITDSGNERSCFGELLEVTERLRNLGSEPSPNLYASLRVPRDGLTELPSGARTQSNRFQRDNTSR